MRVFRFAAILLLAAIAADAGPSFHVKKGVYLWHVWINPPYREAFPSWIDFEKKVATINNLQNSDNAFRHLPSGFELLLPPLSGTVAEEKVNDLQGQIQTLQDQLRANNQEEQTAVRSWKIITLLMLVLSLTLAIVIVILMIREKKTAEKQKIYEKNLKTDNERFRFFLDKYMEEIEVPPDIGTFIYGGNKIYLLKADKFNNKTAVVFPGKGQVLIKNIKTHLDNASPEYLREIGIKPSHSIILSE